MTHVEYQPFDTESYPWLILYQHIILASLPDWLIIPQIAVPFNHNVFHELPHNCTVSVMLEIWKLNVMFAYFLS